MRQLRTATYYLTSIFRMVFGFKNWLRVLPFFLTKPPHKKLHLKLRNPQVEIIVRSAMDIWSVKETFLDQFYTRFGTPVQAGWTIIDIGAAIGEYSLYAALAKPGVRVFAFEPFSDSYQILHKNLVINGLQTVKAFQKAVWGRTGTLNLNLETGEPLQIYSYDAKSGDDKSEGLLVEALSLEEAIQSIQIDKVDLLKMDCEGAEYEILRNASRETLAKIDRIIMEYHDLSPIDNHSILVENLQKEGYRVEYYPNIVHREIGYLFAERE